MAGFCRSSPVRTSIWRYTVSSASSGTWLCTTKRHFSGSIPAASQSSVTSRTDVAITSGRSWCVVNAWMSAMRKKHS